MSKIQVISGKFKGLQLESSKNENLRPTKDRVKESVFDILQFEIINKNFFDAFGGTGQIGIEAFSRGAKEVTIETSSPLWVHTDGEVTRKSNRITLTCEQQAIRIIRP